MLWLCPPTSPYPTLFALAWASGCQVCKWGIQYHPCSTYRGLWGLVVVQLWGSVAEHCRLKPEVSWVRLPATAGFFTFLYFCLITSKFNYFQRETRCSEHLEWEKPLSMGSFLAERIFRSTPNRVLTAHTEWLTGVRLRHSVPSV